MRDLLLVPMHGELKIRAEGLRTRDTHLLEWFERLRPDLAVTVLSRPEPWPRLTMARRAPLPAFHDWEFITAQPFTAPPRDGSRWWVASARWLEVDEPHRATIVWNPIGGAKLAASRRESLGTLVIDLLDDWSEHYAFRDVKAEVESAYRHLLGEADVVVANSEATVQLAARHGRNARLIPNGVDPGRFSASRRLSEQPVVGYLGKLGSRVDLELVEAVCAKCPEVDFQFAGPVIERSRQKKRAFVARLERIPNVTLLGDIPYPRVPDLLETWDAAWIPHSVGSREVGGDAIKQYEYRAAQLPVVSAKIIGHERFLEGVETADDASGTATAIKAFLSRRDEEGTVRRPVQMPDQATWRAKARTFLELAHGARTEAPVG